MQNYVLKPSPTFLKFIFKNYQILELRFARADTLFPPQYLIHLECQKRFNELELAKWLLPKPSFFLAT